TGLCERRRAQMADRLLPAEGQRSAVQYVAAERSGDVAEREKDAAIGSAVLSERAAGGVADDLECVAVIGTEHAAAERDAAVIAQRLFGGRGGEVDGERAE